jgi:hypothetical protein
MHFPSVSVSIRRIPIDFKQSVLRLAGVDQLRTKASDDPAFAGKFLARLLGRAGPSWAAQWFAVSAAQDLARDRVARDPALLAEWHRQNEDDDRLRHKFSLLAQAHDLAKPGAHRNSVLPTLIGAASSAGLDTDEILTAAGFETSADYWRAQLLHVMQESKFIHLLAVFHNDPAVWTVVTGPRQIEHRTPTRVRLKEAIKIGFAAGDLERIDIGGVPYLRPRQATKYLLGAAATEDLVPASLKASLNQQDRAAEQPAPQAIQPAKPAKPARCKATEKEHETVIQQFAETGERGQRKGEKFAKDKLRDRYDRPRTRKALTEHKLQGKSGRPRQTKQT